MCRRCFGACECDICVGELEEASPLRAYETESGEGDEARKAMKSKKAMKPK